MAFSRYLGISAALVLATVCGCHLAALPYFFSSEDPKRDPSIKSLVSEDKKKEVKVLVLTYTVAELPSTLATFESDVSTFTAQKMEEAFKENKEKVTVISPRKVEKYKQDHPNWHSLELEKVGKEFEADFVIYLELGPATLYEKGSSSTFYRGRSEISVSLIDLNKPDQDPLRKELNLLYPSDSQGPTYVSDKSFKQFHLDFLNHVGERISWCFTRHLIAKEFTLD